MSKYIEIGKLNNDNFKKLNIELITDQVIFTFERLQHVEDRRRNVYYEVKEYLPIAIYEPEYIYKDWNNRDNTIVIIKSIKENLKICIIIKIAEFNDEKHNKNSIITIIKIGEKTFRKIYKNKKQYLLYEKVDKNE